VTVVVDGRSLTLGDLLQVARERAPVALAPAAVEQMSATRALVDRLLEDDGTEVYGFTTGVGVRKRVRVGRDEMAAFNRRLVADHLVAQGPAAAEDVVRATMLRLLNAFASGTAAVRPVLAERLVRALNDGEHPHVRTVGGLGLADLGPLADLAADLMAGTPLAAKEGLALLNTNAFSTASAALAVADARRLLDVLRTAAALDLEAFAANLTPLHPAVEAARPHAGLATELAGLRTLLAGGPTATSPARNLQDPLSFRGAGAILGAARDALAHVETVLAVELNASQENPLPVLAEGRFVSVANYEALPLAAALDYLRIALAPCLTAANERAVKLLQAPLTGLTDGLAPPGHEHEGGLSEFAWTIQALAVEARLLAQPVSTEVPSSSQAEGIEDRATMAPLGARRTAEQVALGEHLAAVGLVISTQALELRHGLGAPALSPPLAAALRAVRTHVPYLGPGETVTPDLEPLVAALRAGALATSASA
jgi:histidine ammonia-lyase